jgi:hypothetical protein
MQKTFNEVFADAQPGDIISIENARNAVDNMMDANDTIFREILSNIPERQKEVLYAIAHDGEVAQITSAKFIKHHKLQSASSVQAATKKLLERDMVTVINKVYSVTDKLFGLWIARLNGKEPGM